MTYFTKEFSKFFTELADNNHKEWLDANRKRYEKEVKEPFSHFIEALIEKIAVQQPEMKVKAKDCIFRINRDIRFSKDKTPYKLNRSAFISVFGKKSGDFPGFYLDFSADKLLFGGGVYMPSKEGLFKIRQEIAYNLKAFAQLYKDSKFVEYYDQIQGDKNKILPPDFKDDALVEPLLYNKSLFFMAELSSAQLLSKELLSMTFEYYQVAQPINNFFSQALKD